MRQNSYQSNSGQLQSNNILHTQKRMHIRRNKEHMPKVKSLTSQGATCPDRLRTSDLVHVNDDQCITEK